MAEYIKEKLDINPSFDIFALMELMQETRLGGDVMEELGTTWDSWLNSLHVYSLKIGKISYLLAYLDKNVEKEIDQKWADSPSSSFRINCLGQCLLMAAVQSAIPEVVEAGCAPAPKPTDALLEVLEEIGIPYLPEGTGLSYRFSTITHFPFRGACEICHLQANCPKAQANASSFHTVELKGQE